MREARQCAGTSAILCSSAHKCAQQSDPPLSPPAASAKLIHSLHCSHCDAAHNSLSAHEFSIRYFQQRWLLVLSDGVPAPNCSPVCLLIQGEVPYRLGVVVVYARRRSVYAAPSSGMEKVGSDAPWQTCAVAMRRHSHWLRRHAACCRKRSIRGQICPRKSWRMAAWTDRTFIFTLLVPSVSQPVGVRQLVRFSHDPGASLSARQPALRTWLAVTQFCQTFCSGCDLRTASMLLLADQNDMSVRCQCKLDSCWRAGFSLFKLLACINCKRCLLHPIGFHLLVRSADS